ANPDRIRLNPRIFEMKNPRTCLAILISVALALLLAGCASRQETSVSALHHFKKGNEALQLEAYGGAIRHYNLALAYDKNSPEILYNLGLAYYRSGSHKQAVAAFNAALRLRPEMYDAHYNLALSYDKLYNAEAAHSQYNTYRLMVDGATAQRQGAASNGARPGRIVPFGAAGKPAPGTVRVTQQRLLPQAQGARAGGRGTTTGQMRARGPAGRRNPASLPSKGAARARPGPTKTRQAAARQFTAAPAKAETTSEENGKWWIQDRFTRKR
ncbi:MAG: tetratricopeptide repeat protein, partial [SAR324 cluster bacterium]|nr:tetratricopeptide repeat protein [SAR324 cluster bacterium]